MKIKIKNPSKESALIVPSILSFPGVALSVEETSGEFVVSDVVFSELKQMSSSGAVFALLFVSETDAAASGVPVTPTSKSARAKP